MRYTKLWLFWPLLIIAIIVYITPASAADETVKLKEYVHKLINDGYQLFNDTSISETERLRRSAELIRVNLDSEWMAKYTLGRHRKSLNQAQMREFIEAYSKFIVKVYSDLSKNYNGEKAIIKRVNQLDKDRFIVSIEIVKPTDQSIISVEYLVHQGDSKSGRPFQVADVITEGVSIISSQQAEFDSIIRAQGIDALITDLKNKKSGK